MEPRIERADTSATQSPRTGGPKPRRESHQDKMHLVVIDDESEMRSLLKEFFTSQGYRVSDFSSATEARKSLVSEGKNRLAQLEDVDLVLSDIRMPGMSGVELMLDLKQHRPEILVILATAFGSIESAIEAIRQGAYDYVTKPFKLSELAVTVSRASEFTRLRKENQRLREQFRSSHSFHGIIGKSPAMQSVFDLIRRVSGTNSSVLITGESGTGKEIVARTLHNLSPRGDKPFVAINCSAIPESLLESELFGHAKGSFTGAGARKKGLFEEAEGGTLFLDEIGDMPLLLQAKILRVLQERKIRPVGDNTEKPVDVRIVAATHKDIKSAVKAGNFREDLYYRLSVIPIVIPPLRHRTEDIPLLAEAFLRKHAQVSNQQVKGFSPSALTQLVNNRWEGNVRELENAVERAVILATQDYIEEGDLPFGESEDLDAHMGKSFENLVSLDVIERRYIEFVLKKTGNRKEKAAQILGINRRTLYRKELEYGLALKEDGEEEPPT